MPLLERASFLRTLGEERILVVANLSRFVQVARLNLEKLKGTTPVELFGRERFPDVTDAPYFMSLGPHDFYWLALEKPHADPCFQPPDGPTHSR